MEPAQAYETVSGRILLSTLHNVRERAVKLVERRPPGEHAAQRKPRHLAANAREAGVRAKEQAREHAKDLQVRAREWVRENDTPTHRTGALGVAAAVVIAGVVGGTAGTAEPELRLERQSVTTAFGADDGAAAPAQAAEPAAAPPAAPAAETAPAEEAAPVAAEEPAPQGPVAPLDSLVLTSPFGYRDNPLSPGYPEFHTGADFGAVTGTPVKASAAGTVVEAGWHTTGGGGLRVVIDHGDGLQTTYNHLNSIDVGVGQAVEAGDVIAGVGSTGNSTGPHLHYEVLRHGEYTDPMAWL